MQTFKIWLLILPLVGLTGCIVSYKDRWDGRTVELSRMEDDDRNTEIYELKQASDEDGISLIVRSETVSERPELGFTLVEIDKNLAQEKMLTPYSGLYVQEVQSNGVAAKAGILPGDILTTVNGTEVLYLQLYEHVLKNNPPESALALTLLRGFEHKKTVSLSVKPGFKQVMIPSTKAIPLDLPEVEGPTYAGLHIGTLPAEWTEKVYGERRPTVLISKVLIGSPAYRAGLRSGDRILTINELYFNSATAVKEWIMARGEDEETVRFEVYRKPDGVFRTDVRLRRVDEESHIIFPLIFTLDDNTRRTCWDVGPAGIVCGYDGIYRGSNNRSVNYQREISCLIGLINYTWSPETARLRLLWFIKIGSD
jgi:hypothetical protein